MTNLYRELKNKYKIARDDNMYENYITSVVSVMFKWDEKIYRPELLDKIIRDVGMSALIKTDTSDYTPVWFYPIDSGNGRYADGWFKDCVCFDFNSKEYKFEDWKDNKDILVFFNTPLRNPDLFVEKYSEALSDIDFSIKNNVHYSRQHPIPVARDRKTKNRIDQCIKDVANGDFNTILMEASIGDIIGEDDIKLLNITDVQKSQYLQYLSHLHDSYISRLFFLLGLGTTDNGKQAQISVDELNKNDDASITMALAWYRARKDAIDNAKRKGHDLSFDFSDIWKKRIESIMNENIIADNNSEESNEESEAKEDDSEPSSDE